MRRFDKKENIRKANILAEQRHLQSKGLIIENEDWDLESRKQEYGINPEIDQEELNSENTYKVEVIGKEAEKDGGYKHSWVYEITANNEEEAEAKAADKFNENFRLSDIYLFSVKTITNPTEDDKFQPRGTRMGEMGIDEDNVESQFSKPSFAQGISQKYKLRLLPNPMDVVQATQKYKESKGNFGGNFEGIMTYDPSSSVVVVLSKNEKAGEEVFNEFKKFNANDVGYESFGITVDGYKFPLDTQPSDKEKAFVKSFKIN